jgi:SAM-dependent methyltransferase
MGDTNVDIFSRNASLYDVDYWREDEEKAISFLIPGKLLVGGVGAGRTLQHLQGKGFEITAIDISPEMVKLCRKNFPTLDVRVMDLQRTSFADGIFDSIFLPFHTIAYVDDLDATLIELRRILKFGGKLVFSIPNRWNIKAILDGSAFKGKKRLTHIQRGSNDLLETHVLSTRDTRAVKNFFTQVHVSSRISMQDIANPNWKDRLLQSVPFLDKSLYFFCTK